MQKTETVPAMPKGGESTSSPEKNDSLEARAVEELIHISGEQEEKIHAQERELASQRERIDALERENSDLREQISEIRSSFVNREKADKLESSFASREKAEKDAGIYEDIIRMPGEGDEDFRARARESLARDYNTDDSEVLDRMVEGVIKAENKEFEASEFGQKSQEEFAKMNALIDMAQKKVGPDGYTQEKVDATAKRLSDNWERHMSENFADFVDSQQVASEEDREKYNAWLQSSAGEESQSEKNAAKYSGDTANQEFDAVKNDEKTEAKDADSEKATEKEAAEDSESQAKKMKVDGKDYAVVENQDGTILLKPIEAEKKDSAETGETERAENGAESEDANLEREKKERQLKSAQAIWDTLYAPDDLTDSQKEMLDGIDKEEFEAMAIEMVRSGQLKMHELHRFYADRHYDDNKDLFFPGSPESEEIKKTNPELFATEEDRSEFAQAVHDGDWDKVAEKYSGAVEEGKDGEKSVELAIKYALMNGQITIMEAIAAYRKSGAPESDSRNILHPDDEFCKGLLKESRNDLNKINAREEIFAKHRKENGEYDYDAIAAELQESGDNTVVSEENRKKMEARKRVLETILAKSERPGDLEDTKGIEKSNRPKDSEDTKARPEQLGTMSANIESLISEENREMLEAIMEDYAKQANKARRTLFFNRKKNRNIAAGLKGAMDKVIEQCGKDVGVELAKQNINMSEADLAAATAALSKLYYDKVNKRRAELLSSGFYGKIINAWGGLPTPAKVAIGVTAGVAMGAGIGAAAAVVGIAGGALAAGVSASTTGAIWKAGKLKVGLDSSYTIKGWERAEKRRERRADKEAAKLEKKKDQAAARAEMMGATQEEQERIKQDVEAKWKAKKVEKIQKQQAKVEKKRAKFYDKERKNNPELTDQELRARWIHKLEQDQYTKKAIVTASIVAGGAAAGSLLGYAFAENLMDGGQPDTPETSLRTPEAPPDPNAVPGPEDIPDVPEIDTDGGNWNVNNVNDSYEVYERFEDKVSEMSFGTPLDMENLDNAAEQILNSCATNPEQLASYIFQVDGKQLISWDDLHDKFGYNGAHDIHELGDWLHDPTAHAAVLNEFDRIMHADGNYFGTRVMEVGSMNSGLSADSIDAAGEVGDTTFVAGETMVPTTAFTLYDSDGNALLTIGGPCQNNMADAGTIVSSGWVNIHHDPSYDYEPTPEPGSEPEPTPKPGPTPEPGSEPEPTPKPGPTPEPGSEPETEKTLNGTMRENGMAEDRLRTEADLDVFGETDLVTPVQEANEAAAAEQASIEAAEEQVRQQAAENAAQNVEIAEKKVEETAQAVAENPYDEQVASEAAQAVHDYDEAVAEGVATQSYEEAAANAAIVDLGGTADGSK